MNLVVITRNLVCYGGISNSLKYLSEGWKKLNLNTESDLNYVVLESIDKTILKKIKDNSVKVIVCSYSKQSRLKQFLKVRKILRVNNFDYILCTCLRTYLFAKLSSPFSKNIIMWFRGTNYLGSFFKRIFFNMTNNTIPFVNSYYTAKDNNLKKYIVIHNGISSDFLRVDGSNFYNKFGIPRESRILGFIGDWIYWKNHMTLIRAFNLLVREYDNIYLICIGGQNTELRNKVMQVVTCKNRVRFVNKIIYASKYLKYFDVYVHPAWAEGFGNAVVEAMYAGCPIVAARSGAIPELIRDNIEGLLYYPSTSFLDCYYAIKKVLNDNILSEKLIMNAKIKAIKCFSAEAFAKRFSSAINENI